jgi:hypothetical protein
METIGPVAQRGARPPRARTREAAHSKMAMHAAGRPSSGPKRGARVRRRPMRGEAYAHRRFCEQAPKLDPKYK